MSIVEVENFSKKYGDFTAVDNISFSVEEGQFFAFLGPNGAGKSTTINCISTLLSPTSGKISVAGFEAIKQDNEIRNSIGLVFQDSVLDPILTVRENLKTRASFYGLSAHVINKRIDDISEQLFLSDILDRRYGKLSGGQRRRCDVARALVNSPKVLFLDEPTTGLDPQTRVKVWDMVRDMQKRTNMTVFLTTHYMEESASADYVCIIDGGKLSAQGTPAELRLKYSSDILKLQGNLEIINKALIDMGHKPRQEVDIIKLPVKSSKAALEILKKIEDEVTDFEVIRGTMDDVFINVTGHAIREEE